MSCAVLFQVILYTTFKWLTEYGQRADSQGRAQNERETAARSKHWHAFISWVSQLSHEFYIITDYRIQNTVSQSVLILYDLKLLRRQDSIKSSRAISHVRCIKETDVLRTISVLIIRALISYHILIMGTEMVLETSVSFIHLMRLSAQ
jgi:hypothetical protein